MVMTLMVKSCAFDAFCGACEHLERRMRTWKSFDVGGTCLPWSVCAWECASVHASPLMCVRPWFSKQVSGDASCTCGVCCRVVGQ